MMTRESLIEWASSWVPDEPPGQRKRFAESLAAEMANWKPVAMVVPADPNTSAGVFDAESSLGVFDYKKF